MRILTFWRSLIPIIFLLLFLLSLIEISVLVLVGQVIGGGFTILAVLATAVLGSILLKKQGLATLTRFRARAGKGELPATELIEGVMLIVAGALLITPGFVTDAIGFAVMVPSVRVALAHRLIRSGRFSMAGNFGFHAAPEQPQRNERAEFHSEGGNGRTIEGEYRREDEKK